ncbi:MAG: EAL domain-containing protein [Nitrosomonadales bacterium]|nr:EAL domain-containing protein [Nitrosomonadales bacterium]
MSFAAGMLGPSSRSEPKIAPRVLLVDDEPRLLSSLCELLKGRDYQLVTAGSGREALDYLSRGGFDLVVLDMRLPDMSGHEIMDFINAHKVGASVIVISGNSDIDTAIGALKRGAFDYLRKPYAREELLRTVDNALRQRALEADNRLFAWRLENSEKSYRYLVDNSPDIIYTLDEDGLFTFINERVQHLLGFSRDELIGRHYSVLVHEEDIELARYVFKERRIGERASRNVELRLKCGNGGNENRTFENSLLTISFNSMGMYASEQNEGGREFFGTYGVARDITERKRVEDLIAYHAYHDVLTDLPNRPLFKDRLGLAVIQAQRSETKLAVMLVDLDRFKLVNDTLGHIKGDELLQQAAARLKACLRRGDTLSRLGGDEFTLVLPDFRNRQDVEDIAEKCLGCLQQPFLLDGHEVQISASIGIALFPDHGSSGDELVRHADIAMYHVKGLGKNGRAFYDDSMVDVSHHKLAMEQALRKALERHELEMYYQPQVDVTTGRIVGAEALMRWNHPERGLLSAGEFLATTEENGLMLPISDWMLEAIFSDLIEWNAVGGEAIRMSLNLSPLYLDRGGFFEKLKGSLTRYGVPAEQIEVEVTENICIRNPQRAIEQLNRLDQVGVSVAIDDFGTGYSSLAYLQRFPIHTIKIDQSFVREIHRDDSHAPIVLAVISIAKGLGLNVIAEGVETETQASYLQRAGCSTMQGYLYHRPIPQRQLINLLQRQAQARVVAGIERAQAVAC